LSLTVCILAKKDIAEILIAKGADVNLGDPLRKAQIWHLREMVELLRSHGAKDK